MIALSVRNAFLAVPVAAFALASTPTFAAPVFFQGFETDTAGWTDPTRVASGTNGITSASGNFHAQATTDYTFWGGENASNGGPGPFQPYTTSIDIFLNVAGGASTDTRFDFTSAINDTSGNHLRDFAFNAGFYDSADLTGPGDGSDRFIISASNNTGPSNSFPANPARDPFAITSSGWYTFQHSFFDDGGQLAVTLSILDAANTPLHSWTLGGQDAISTAGGSGYGWFANNEFAFLAIDNSSLETADASAVPLPAAFPLFASGMGVMGLLAWRKKRKDAAGQAAA